MPPIPWQIARRDGKGQRSPTALGCVWDERKRLGRLGQACCGGVRIQALQDGPARLDMSGCQTTRHRAHRTRDGSTNGGSCDGFQGFALSGYGFQHGLFARESGHTGRGLCTRTLRSEDVTLFVARSVPIASHRQQPNQQPHSKGHTNGFIRVITNNLIGFFGGGLEVRNRLRL